MTARDLPRNSVRRWRDGHVDITFSLKHLAPLRLDLKRTDQWIKGELQRFSSDQPEVVTARLGFFGTESKIIIVRNPTQK
ncbi:hypothetical protein [Streptomyces botrytidirepellens]|uniref:Uncharacterized protein n=1 Tax=Streptomyces botrytidirepellens TaxID=2486417 RepID=A0A3M8W8F0_9ACTN|nr:hypothetical protein [Streptomyces botrytidirepellens]RNG26378.1 hypothetical protein EEJ42_15110 [Streptomyces botrytidirepellens]